MARTCYDPRPRCAWCGRLVNQAGEYIYSTPDGAEVGLCGRPKPCRDQYNHEAPRGQEAQA